MTLGILYSATQPASYQLQRQPYGGGAWANDTTQPAAGVKAVSALTYDGTTQGVSVATNHGWTLLTDRTYFYRVLPTYSDGSTGDASLPILPVSQAAYECVVSGVIANWVAVDHPGATVRGKLSGFQTAGGAEYETTVTPCAVGSDGSWSLVVPLGATVEFAFPMGDKPVRVIPASGGTAAFEALATA